MLGSGVSKVQNVVKKLNSCLLARGTQTACGMTSGVVTMPIWVNICAIVWQIDRVVDETIVLAIHRQVEPVGITGFGQQTLRFRGIVTNRRQVRDRSRIDLAA